ncbi:MAG: maleylpyruvate isomerase family mycothiol-dependent enzyme [Phycicoccus sp.]
MAPADLRPRADVELVERAVAFTCGALAGVADAEAGAVTPCARWVLADLLVHMVDSFEVVTELALGRVSAAGPPPESVRPELLARHLRLLGCTLLDGWITRASSRDVRDSVLHDGRTRLDVETASGVAALEVAVHGWDVARARGAVVPLPPLLAAALLPAAVAVVPVRRRDGRFASPFAPPATDPSSLLLAHLGRDPNWAPR